MMWWVPVIGLPQEWVVRGDLWWWARWRPSNLTHSSSRYWWATAWLPGFELVKSQATANTCSGVHMFQSPDNHHASKTDTVPRARNTINGGMTWLSYLTPEVTVAHILTQDVATVGVSHFLAIQTIKSPQEENRLPVLVISDSIV